MALIEGVARRFGYALGGAQVGARVTDVGSLAMDNVKPLKAELARANTRFNAVVGNGATFIAPVTAFPTTTATWFLYNGDPVRSYFIDTAYAFLASGTAGVGASLLGAVSLGRQLIPTAYASTVITSSSGKANGVGAILANAFSLVGQPAWEVLATDGSLSASTTIGQGLVAQVNGGMMVPPGWGFALTVLSGTGTSALYGVGITFHALQADAE